MTAEEKSLQETLLEGIEALGKQKVTVESAGAAVRTAMEQTRKQERERAAKLVEDLLSTLPPHDAHGTWADEWQEMPDKIRGEEND